MISINTDSWELRHWGFAILFVLLILSAAFWGGYVFRNNKVEELTATIEHSSEGVNAKERSRLENERKEWDTRRAEEEAKLKLDRKAFDDEQQKYAKELNLGRQNSQQIELQVARIRDESEAAWTRAIWLMFGEIVAFFVAAGLLYFVHRKQRADFRKDQLDFRADLAVDRDNAASVILNSQRADLALRTMDKLKDNPAAMERALALMFSARPALSVPPTGPSSTPDVPSA